MDARDAVGIGERLERPRRRRGRLIGVGVRKQDGELVAAEPRHGVPVAHAVAQHARRGLQDAVTGAMAVEVVDRLEVVEVEQHDRPARGVGQRGEVPADDAPEPAPVEQLGEGVVLGLVDELVLDSRRSVMSIAWIRSRSSPAR